MSQDQLVRVTGIPYLAPSRTTHSTILDYAHIIEDPLGIDVDGLIWSFNCIGMDVNPVDNCVDFLGLTKRFDSPSSAPGFSFVVQGGVTCKPFGFDMNDPGLRSAFDAIESTGVSTGLSYTVFSTAQDLTGGVAVPPTTALGLLEALRLLPVRRDSRSSTWVPAWSARPQPRARSSTTVASCTTVLGTPIAVSAGYETKTADILDPEQVAYVSGAVVLARSDVVLQSSLNQSNNDAVVLYERLYMAAVDCLVGKVKVKVY